MLDRMGDHRKDLNRQEAPGENRESGTACRSRSWPLPSTRHSNRGPHRPPATSRAPTGLASGATARVPSFASASVKNKETQDKEDRQKEDRQMGGPLLASTSKKRADCFKNRGSASRKARCSEKRCTAPRRCTAACVMTASLYGRSVLICYASHCAACRGRTGSDAPANTARTLGRSSFRVAR
jgi:hypothetical protein